MNTYRRRRPGFITIHRDAIAELRQKLGADRSTLGVFIELLAEADVETGEITGSLRWLAQHLGLARNTLKRHLEILRAADLLEVHRGRPGAPEGTFIEIPEYDWLTGVDPSASPSGSTSDPRGSTSDPPGDGGGSVSGSTSDPLVRVGGSVGGQSMAQGLTHFVPIYLRVWTP